jgi:hypothetical protein
MQAMNHGGLGGVAIATRPTSNVPPEIAVVAEAPNGLAFADLATPAKGSGAECGFPLDQGSGLCEAMDSSCGDSEGRVSDTACPSQLSALLHDLSNLMTGILLNAQVLEWKLPPYSHLKRPVREMTRNAQRGSELMKRLQRLGTQIGHAEAQAVTLVGNGSGVKLPSPKTERPDPAVARVDTVLPNQVLDLTATCDTRTSNAFPKRDDRDGR